ncbi:hypothetical protein ASE74_15845 [Pedobacter sp. Leaf216]|uniref:hypothetical protein n=1 Tax=Pedobacter sp. Leaf216 TaxID=1735684 RepID=UPI0006F41E29|nr:hypothetical protein [Pedobacter sp. Leaf216]KQM77871.1 hypothetical protein ASE74_15845 [Pedobacter sp. Leaf216]
MSDFNKKERLAYLKEKISKLDTTLSPLMEMAAFLGVKFDFSLDSLDYLELILMKISPDFNLPEHSGLYEDSWIYLGETYRRVLKGKWSIADDEDYYKESHDGLPMVTDFDPYNSELFPMIIIDVFMDRKTPQLMRQQVEQYLGMTKP